MKVISRIIIVIWIVIRMFCYFVVAIGAFFAYLLLAIGAAIGIGVGKTTVHEGKILVRRISALSNKQIEVDEKKGSYVKKE